MRAPALAVATLLVSACIPAAADARTFVTKGIPDDRPVYKPRTFVAGSGAGGGVLGLRGVRWSQWSARSARGRGTLRLNVCDPTCADGNYRSYRARITLSRPRRGCSIYRAGAFAPTRRRLFTRITLRFDGRTFRSLTSGTQSCQ